ncbi:V-type ATP synthase subunit F [Clostridium thermarum]|uniref:V-type ATP synthase subunit F n=1 Tax=Clostridium thermarum TaxID=1716543 RepID=UPI0013D6D187|nr:V-type ATP synthase subunit F [Clostridium thermarum]
MKTFLISDNVDTYVGLRIAGINGIVLHNKEEIEFIIDKLIQDKELGIIILTEKAAAVVQDKLREIKLRSTLPLIVEIPDRHGSYKGKDAMLNYIKDSIGLKI